MLWTYHMLPKLCPYHQVLYKYVLIGLNYHFLYIILILVHCTYTVPIYCSVCGILFWDYDDEGLYNSRTHIHIMWSPLDSETTYLPRPTSTSLKLQYSAPAPPPPGIHTEPGRLVPLSAPSSVPLSKRLPERHCCRVPLPLTKMAAKVVRETICQCWGGLPCWH